ncbi:MAG TPA: serine acetyltransferase [Thermoanaerobaculia bacterium]
MTLNENGTAHEEILATVVDQLCAEAVAAAGPRWGGRLVLPSRDTVLECMEGIRQVFFPGYFGATDLHDKSLHYYVGATLDHLLHELEEQVTRAVAFAEGHDFATCDHCAQVARKATKELLQRLPEIRRLVASDVEAAFVGDPALRIRDEAIFSYPGLYAVTEQRIAHELYLRGVPLIPRIITEHAHGETGIDIHPGAAIGEAFFIDHGTGVVIGETARIGNRVRIYQGVTLGAKSFPKDDRGVPIKGVDRHPIVEDDVVIYAGATILGRVTIGRGASIGGNVWLTHGVAPGSRVTQAEVQEDRFQDGAGI